MIFNGLSIFLKRKPLIQLLTRTGIRNGETEGGRVGGRGEREREKKSKEKRERERGGGGG